jgi:hypothetical protein
LVGLLKTVRATESGTGQRNDRRNSELNQVREVDRVAHCWYRFVLSFPPHLVQHYLARFGVTEQQQVLDPFCGTGTTVVECKKLAIPSVGIEANPMAQFAGTVKLDWSPDPDRLWESARRIGEISAALSEKESEPFD